jgi:hypothetical protein
MPWAAVGAIVGAGISADAAAGASSAAEQQDQLNRSAQQGWNSLVDPFTAGGNRSQYVTQLNDLMQGGYAGIQNDPMYQWMLGQGQDQLQRGMSARGQLGSGNEMIALQKQGTGMAMDFFNQQYARLADLSGASRGGGQAVIGQNPANVYNMYSQYGQEKGAAFGGAMRGIGAIFGQGQGGGGGVYSGDYNPNSYGTYDPNPNGLNP